MSSGRTVFLWLCAAIASIALAVVAISPGAVLASSAGTCTYSSGSKTTTCTVGASLTTNQAANSDGTYWLFVLNGTPSGAPSNVTACWASGYCGNSVLQTPEGGGNTSQYVMPESAENTNSNGLPLTPVSATAVIVGQSETSNFVLGAIPGESYCSLASGDDATEASVVTDANGSCRAIPAAVTTTTVTSSTTAGNDHYCGTGRSSKYE